jgi:hypothetical protein
MEGKTKILRNEVECNEVECDKLALERVQWRSHIAIKCQFPHNVEHWLGS